MHALGAAFTSAAFPNKHLIMVGNTVLSFLFIIVDRDGFVVNVINVAPAYFQTSIQKGLVKQVGHCKVPRSYEITFT